MIIKEFYGQRKDGVVLHRTYSDIGMMILQNETGIEYAEAIDVEGAQYTYIETDNPIEPIEPDFDIESDFDIEPAFNDEDVQNA